MTNISLYIHLPFCKKKCSYCDFVSYAGKEDLIDEYVEALVREINSPPCQHEFSPPPSLFKRGGKEGGEFSTIFFGGGTPTLLEPWHFENILHALSPWERGDGSRQRVRASEVTIEANPGTADKAKLKALHALGINRLSIGVQSFNNKHLKTLGRIHTAEEAMKFYNDARAAGFENINLDLMFALPNQTLEEWQADLQTAIDLKPNHLSTYNLQLEENTPLWEKFFPHPLSLWERGPGGEGSLELPSEETDLAMYEYTIETLVAAGYKHYEISNFAKPGFECQHNINYWQNGNWLGIGAGAHSHVNGKRWSNPNCVETYIATPVKSAVADETSGGETIFLGLRLLDGISTDHFKGFEKEVAELIEDGLLTKDGSNYKFTHRGLLLGNLVFEKFV